MIEFWLSALFWILLILNTIFFVYNGFKYFSMPSDPKPIFNAKRNIYISSVIYLFLVIWGLIKWFFF